MRTEPFKKLAINSEMPTEDRWSGSTASSQSTVATTSTKSTQSRRGSASSSQPEAGRMSSAGDRKSGGSAKWMKQVKNWIAVSEPSAQAIRSQRRDTYKRHGVHQSDPDAAAKMHLPIGVLPRGTTTSTSGPTPEEKLQKERRERPHMGTKHASSHSVSSGYSSGAGSFKGKNPIAPW